MLAASSAGPGPAAPAPHGNVGGSGSATVTHPLRVLATACGGAFIAFLDVTVVNLAFPDLQQAFPRVALTDLSWVITAYAVFLAALMTPGGRLADVIGRRRLFLVGVATFTLASATCLVSPDFVLLVSARAVQGAAAAAMIPASLGLVLAATPRERLAHAVGLWGASAALAAAAGPTLGGILVDLYGWRAVFAINVPVGLLILLVGARTLREVRSADRRLPDPLGTVALTAGVALVVVGITKGVDWGWSSPATLVSSAGGAVLVGWALWRSTRSAAPAVATDLWRDRVFAAANLTSLLFGAALYAWLLNIVLFLNAIWGYSPLKSAWAVTPGAAAAAAASILTGRLTTIRAQRIAVCTGSLLLAAVGLWLYDRLGTRPEFLLVWLPAAVVSGAGMGLALTGVSSAAAGSAPPERFAAATGLNITGRQLGGALGIAGLTMILQKEVGHGSRGFTQVFLFCAVLSVASALSALRMSPRTASDSSFHQRAFLGHGRRYSPRHRIPRGRAGLAPRHAATPVTASTARQPAEMQ